MHIVQSLQITTPFHPGDEYILNSTKELKNWINNKHPNLWITSIEQIYTPNEFAPWTLRKSILQYPKLKNRIIQHALQTGYITTIIKHKLTPDWKGIPPLPLRKKPSKIFKHEYNIAKKYSRRKN